MKTDYVKFFKVKMPPKGYHCFDGNDELHVEKNLSFPCECGQNHSAVEAEALITFAVENKTLYRCPQNPLLFVLVRPTGIFKIKGLKNIAAYEASDEGEVDGILLEVESRKSRS